jgi:hypothetical protein
VRNHLWKLTSRAATLSDLDSRRQEDHLRVQPARHLPNVFWKSSDGTGRGAIPASANTQVTESWLPRGETLLFVELRPPPKGWDILTCRFPIRQADRSERPSTGHLRSRRAAGIWPTSRESGAQESTVRSFPGPGVGLPVGNGNQPAWRRRAELYYRSAGRMMVASVTTEPRFEISKSTVL